MPTPRELSPGAVSKRLSREATSSRQRRKLDCSSASLRRGSFDSESNEVLNGFLGQELPEWSGTRVSSTSVETLVSRGGLRPAALASPKQKSPGVSQETPLQRYAFSGGRVHPSKKP